MKKMMLLWIIGILLPMISYGQEQAEEPEKIYVQSNQVAIVDQGIFAFVKNQWVPVTVVCADVFGLYVVGVTNYPYTRWICKAPGCNYNNDGRYTTCQRKDDFTGQLCGAPRPK